VVKRSQRQHRSVYGTLITVSKYQSDWHLSDCLEHTKQSFELLTRALSRSCPVAVTRQARGIMGDGKACCPAGSKLCCSVPSSVDIAASGLKCRFGSVDVPAMLCGDTVCCAPPQLVSPRQPAFTA